MGVVLVVDVGDDEKILFAPLPGLPLPFCENTKPERNGKGAQSLH